MYKQLLFFILLLLPLQAWTYAEEITIVTENLPPFQIEAPEDGSVSGVSVEIVKTVADQVGIPYTISSNPWARSYKMARNKPNVLIFSIGRNPEREKEFHWVGTITNIKSYFYKLASRQDIQINSYADAKQYVTGVPRDDMRFQTLVDKGIPEKMILQVKDMDTTWKMLFKGRIDLVIEDETTMNYLLKRLKLDTKKVKKMWLVPEHTIDLYMAFSIQTAPRIVGKYIKALEKIKADGTYDSIKAKCLL